MNQEKIKYACVLLLGVFISAISQVMLKKASQKKYASVMQEYLNPLVIFANQWSLKLLMERNEGVEFMEFNKN